MSHFILCKINILISYMLLIYVSFPQPKFKMEVYASVFLFYMCCRNLSQRKSRFDF